ncbi:MAG: hypothetical protein V1933_03415 [Candidatus Omnitrophota bacterium]
MSSRKQSGAILIITLWIIAILAALSVGIGGRAGLDIKLAGFYRDNMRVLYLAKAAIERAIAEKQKDAADPDNKSDSLNESWSDNKDLFYNHAIEGMANTSYTVSYGYKEDLSDKGSVLYGMMDEASKININKIVNPETSEIDMARKGHFENLLQIVCGLNASQAASLSEALIDWIDADHIALATSEDEDEKYYQDAGGVSYCKNSALESLEELPLIKGFESVILYGDKQQGKCGIIDFVTIYTDGRVNVNTAPKEVLESLGFTADQAGDVISYRKGQMESSTGGVITGLENLTDATIVYSDSENIGNINEIIPYLSTTSDTYRCYVTANVNRVKKKIDCVVSVVSGELPGFKYWKEY